MVHDPSSASPNEQLNDGRFITLDQIDAVLLRPGDAITELNSDQDFNSLEAQIMTRISSEGNGLGDNTILKKPLATQLRPKGFLGELRNGTASILPNDEEALEALAQRRKTVIHNSSTVSLLLIAEMYSTGRGILGHVVRNAVYYSGKGVVRVLGDAQNIKNAEAVVVALNLQAVERASIVSKYAIQHVLHGGLPGLGKRR